MLHYSGKEVQFKSGDWRAAYFTRYSIFLDQTDFGVQKQNEKSPWVFFFSPCPPPFFSKAPVEQ